MREEDLGDENQNTLTAPSRKGGEDADLVPGLVGRELDAAVAERVMGWEVLEVGYFGTEEETPRMRELAQWMDDVGLEAVGTYAINVEANFFRELSTGFGTWSPSSDIADAMEVLDKADGMWELVRCVEREDLRSPYVLRYSCRLRFGDDFGGVAGCMTAPEAICRAALQAVSGTASGHSVMAG